MEQKQEYPSSPPSPPTERSFTQLRSPIPQQLSQSVKEEPNNGCPTGQRSPNSYGA